MVRDLDRYLRRVLGTTLRSRRLSEEELGDLAQEAFSQLLSHLHTFRGDSAFPTWAAAVATRVALTELRRRAAIEEKHAAFRKSQEDANAPLAFTLPEPDEGEWDGSAVLGALHGAIASCLTERQRVATLALLRGIPTIEIAEQLDSNQNAVYKVVHDARLRLREALERQGITLETILEMGRGEAQQ